MTKISTKSGKQRNIEENYVISNPLTFSVKTYKDKGLDPLANSGLHNFRPFPRIYRDSDAR